MGKVLLLILRRLLGDAMQEPFVTTACWDFLVEPNAAATLEQSHPSFQPVYY